MARTRRTFLQHTGLGMAATLAASSYNRAADASTRLTLGVIGPGGMGSNHLRALVTRKDVTIAWLCDPNAQQLAAAGKITSAAGVTPKTTKDMREVYADSAVDAVLIATPDHWHTPAALLALEANKHVYVEKPCSHNVREGRLLVEAARRSKKVVQTGTQSRSTRHVQEAMARLKAGAIGEVLVCRVWNSQRRRDIGKTQPSKPPAHLDFDFWLGPAPVVDYRSNMLPGIWRWWFDFGCGDMGNDGVHDIDIGRWGLGVTTHPTTITAIGGKYFFNDDQQFPDTQTVIFEYAGEGKARPKQLIFEQRIWSPYVQEGHENGNAFYGTKGYMIFGKGGGWQIFGERNKPGETMRGSPDLPAHHQNFIDCIRKGGTPTAEAEIGHLSASLCHLGNLATRLGRTLKFDPEKEQVVNDAAANQMVRRKYREGHWAVPKNL